MKMQDLKAKIFFLFFAIIFIFGSLMFIVGARVINNDIIARAQAQIKNDLRVAHSVFNGEIEAIRTGFNLIPVTADLAEVKEKMGLDYLYIVEEKDKAVIKSEIVLRAFSGQATGGIRVIGTEELKLMGEGVYKKCAIDIRYTQKSRPVQQKVLEEAMVIGYAMPVFDDRHRVNRVVYGGKIINRDFALVDKIRDLVFENKFYDKKPLGTVTIFLHDIRIATNVLDNEGNRAIGTAVSETVYKKVLGEGKSWLDRAFVVTDWYLTAYEPLKNINGEVIGILYVGIMEKPFRDLEKRVLMVFMAIILFVAALAVILSFLLADAISRPVKKMLAAMHKVSGGDLKLRIKTADDIQELAELAATFNDMTAKLDERDENLKDSHEKLASLNKSYLDLIGFVAHELKGILASTLLNAYAVRDGFLGLINFKQRKALDSVARNLDYLDATVKNFLDLSRIEKGELNINKTELLCKEDVFDPAIENFLKPASERGMEIINSIEAGAKIKGDINLLQIVANNLIGNAVKYGNEAGKIIVTSRRTDGLLQVEVYNEGEPLSAAAPEKLFKKFSRLGSPAGKKVKGTGLGLFIAKDIIEKHNGRIWFEPKEKGNSFIFQLERVM